LLSAWRARARRAVSSGGDTAAAVLAGLEVQAIHLEREVSSGMVYGTLIGGPMSAKAVVTKAGAFGREDCLLKLRNELNRPSPSA
jgi:uncharacterized protein YgbK (DUF1537 family)